MTFQVAEYKERAPKLEAVSFTGEFENAGLIANFAGASSFTMSKATGELVLNFDQAAPVTVKIGDMVVKSAGVVTAQAADAFNAQYESI